MKSEVEKLVKIIEKSEETLNASLQYFGMNLEQLRKNNINPVIPGTETFESFAQRVANLDKSLASYAKIEPILHEKFSDIKLKLAEIKCQQQKLIQEKFKAEIEKKQEESRIALSPLLQWHLQEQWKNVNRHFTVHYKIFWKLSVTYSTVRKMVAPVAISLPKTPTVKKIHPLSQSAEPGYYREYKNREFPLKGNLLTG